VDIDPEYGFNVLSADSWTEAKRLLDQFGPNRFLGQARSMALGDFSGASQGLGIRF
jgi:hypothetical protein